MFRTCWKLLLLGVVLVGTATAATSEAEAGYWWGCARPARWISSPYCCVPCCSPCCSPCDGWYLGYRPGPVRRLLFGPYRWYSPVCCPVCYDDPCCCTVTETSPPADEPTPAEQPKPAPAKKPTKAPAPAAGTPNKPAKSPSDAGTKPPSTVGMLTLQVPAEAKVIINGLETTCRGTKRTYMSNNLKPGFAYNYEVRVQLTRNGRPIEKVRNVRLTAGAGEALAFDFAPKPVQVAQLP